MNRLLRTTRPIVSMLLVFALLAPTLVGCSSGGGSSLSLNGGSPLSGDPAGVAPLSRVQGHVALDAPVE
ncbi:MAG: hypothetical protein EB084_23395 [Proteobacteria bacterium]|nr:hypothetical protein [Pseudomonadota bacterium]